MNPIMGETNLNLALALEGRAKATAGNRGLVAIADALAALPDPEIDRTFMLALEARLMTEGLETAPARHLQIVTAEPAFPQTSADELVRVAPVIQMPQRRGVVRRTVASGLVAAMVSAFPLVAAAKSLPGSPFYGLKVRIQHAQIAIFGGVIEDGFAHARLAQERLVEAGQLDAMHADPSLIEATLRAANDELKAAQALIMDNTTDPAALRRFAGMAAESEARIESMFAMTGAARSALDGALVTTRSIQLAVADALGTTTAILTTAIQSSPQHAAQIEPQAATGTSSQPSASDPAATSTNVKDSGDTGSKGNGGNGQGLGGPSEGCQVMGAQNGLGDTLMIVTDLTC